MDQTAMGPFGSLTEMPLERLEAEILAMGANLSAAMSRWLAWIAEYDRRRGWESWEMPSMGHWLSWRAGISRRTAFEHVRVAHALEGLALISAEFAAGRLTYSQVRALTRVADPSIEVGLLAVAQHSTASQLERVVSSLRRCSLLDDDDHDARDRRDERRGVWSRTDEDGSVVLTARLAPDQAALVHKALDRTSVVAESRGLLSQRKADGLVEIAESFLTTGPQDRTGADRTSVVVHVDAAVVADLLPPGPGVPEHARCHLEDGGSLDAATARRLACNAKWTLVAEGPHGQAVAVSAPTRSIPAHVEHAVRRRDRCCRVPGCERTRFLDLHHIRYRAHQGSHDPANLAALCRYHHQAIHDGRLIIEHNDQGALRFRTAAGRLLPQCGPRPNGNPDTVAAAGCGPVGFGNIYGDRFDLAQIVGILSDARDIECSAEHESDDPSECSAEHPPRPAADE